MGSYRRPATAKAMVRRRQPRRPLGVALTGTDLYHDVLTSSAARRSTDWADRRILSQPADARALPATVRRKARLIYQAVDPRGLRANAPDGEFRVCVLAHLRPVKNPCSPRGRYERSLRSLSPARSPRRPCAALALRRRFGLRRRHTGGVALDSSDKLRVAFFGSRDALVYGHPRSRWGYGGRPCESARR